MDKKLKEAIWSICGVDGSLTDCFVHKYVDIFRVDEKGYRQELVCFMRSSDLVETAIEAMDGYYKVIHSSDLVETAIEAMDGYYEFEEVFALSKEGEDFFIFLAGARKRGVIGDEEEMREFVRKKVAAKIIRKKMEGSGS